MDPDAIAVSDYLAVIQLKNEYCHRIDAGDYESWASLFTEDGVFTAGDAYEGRDAILRFAREVFDDRYANTAHIVSNQVVHVDDDQAVGRFYLHFLTEEHDGSAGWMQASYEDEFQLVDGRWRFASVTVTPRLSGSL